MARVNNEGLAFLTGSIGNVTISRARGGITTVRVRTKPANPRTTDQQRNRARFKQLQGFVLAFLHAGFVKPFWEHYATGRLSAYNLFTQANSAALKEGFDPARAVASRGNGLASLTLTAVVPADDGADAYLLNVESGDGGDGSDRLVGILYHAGKNQVAGTTTGFTRAGGMVRVPVPAGWHAEADALFAYAFAYKPGPGGLYLSDSTARKVTPASYHLADPGVPATAPEKKHG